MNIKKLLLTFVVGWVVSFYTTFVFQNLWNWFAVEALHAPEIGYWTMFGLLILIRMVTRKDEATEQGRYEKLTKLVVACVPLEKQDEVREEIEEEKKNLHWTLGGAIIGEAIVIAFALGVGWAVHTFLT
jgi:hypothetical protein